MLCLGFLDAAAATWFWQAGSGHDNSDGSDGSDGSGAGGPLWPGLCHGAEPQVGAMPNARYVQSLLLAAAPMTLLFGIFLERSVALLAVSHGTTTSMRSERLQGVSMLGGLILFAGLAAVYGMLLRHGMPLLGACAPATLDDALILISVSLAWSFYAPFLLGAAFLLVCLTLAALAFCYCDDPDAVQFQAAASAASAASASRSASDGYSVLKG
jgi:hypothetical protein